MEKTQIVVGSSTYVYRTIENKQYLVLATDPDNLDFTFQEKFDKATGRAFFISVVTRSKVWDLPDVATLPPMPPMPQEICIGCTVFKTCHSADGEVMFAPEKLPVELAAGHCWVPQEDRIYGRYTFRNAANGRRCVTLPPTYDYCQRIQRMYAKYSIASTADLKAFLASRAGAEEEALAELIAKHGEESKEYLHVKEQICALFAKYDPSRMGDVIELLEQHEGPEKEAALRDSLVAQYGGELPKTYRERIEAMFAKYVPERLDAMGAVMATFSEREVGLLAALTRKHGPEPGSEERAPEEEERRHRIVAMLIRYAPSTINGDFEQGMAAHKGDATAFIDALVAKYGPEPSESERDGMFESYLSTPAEPTVQAASPVAAPIKPSVWRDRLLRFYAKYNPGKMGSIDKMLRRYEGSEEQLMAELVKTYGPEPDYEPEAPAAPEAKALEGELAAAAAAASEADGEAKPAETEAAVPATEQQQQHVDPNADASVAGDEPTAAATSERSASAVAEGGAAPAAETPVAPTVAVVTPEVPPPAPAPAPVLPRHYELSDDELRRRVTNLVLVHDPSTLDVMETMLSAIGAPLTLYNELLSKYTRDPTAEEIAEAEALLAQRREEERARVAQAEEEARQAKEAQQRHMDALMAEMEALKVQEAERAREDEGRRLRDEAERERQAAALGLLSEAEARRKAAEQSVEAVVRTSEFAAHDEAEDGRYLQMNVNNSSASNASAAVGTILVSTTLAAVDTTTLIGTLAALEDKLQRAYNHMELSIRKGDALRRANEELHFEINELRNIMAEGEKDARIALIEARNESERLLNEQEKEKLNLRATEQAARAEILSSFREEQKRMNDEMLRMAQESRTLNEEVSRQKGEIRELERNIRTLQSRLADKEADELAARAQLKLLQDTIAAKPNTDTSFTQTDDTDVFSSQVFSSPRQYLTRTQVASIEDLQATVRELEGEVSAWRLRFVEVQAEADAGRLQQAKSAEEYDTALRVINMLRAKNKKLEAHTRALDLQLNATSGGAADGSLLSAGTPTRGLEASLSGGPSVSPTTPRYGNSITSPLGASSSRAAASPSSSDTAAAGLSPMTAVELKRRLAASDAESRALRKEITDLRGLLALHMSSPKVRR